MTASVLFLCSGCGTIVGLATGRPKVQLNSNPSGATVTLTGDNGTMIVTNTPAIVTLRRDKGPFVGAHYDVKFELAGYQSYEAQIRPDINPWFWGNFATGVIGFVFVDPFTGAMWTVRPQTIDANLVRTSAILAPEKQNAVVAAVNAPQKSGGAAPPK